MPSTDPIKTPTILVANGVNLDLLGQREPGIYGQKGLKELEAYLRLHLPALTKMCGFTHVQMVFFQSNSEEAYLNEVSKPWDGALLNPGAWTHTSLALGDRLAALALLFVEIHISSTAKREPFRHHSYITPHALGVVAGLGFDSYLAGLLALLAKISSSTEKPNP